jgi:hypothetical protein
VKAASVLLLSILSASESAAAAPPHPGKPCDPHTTSIRRLIRQARSIGGPVARRVRKSLAGLTPRTTHVERGIRPPAAEDSQAIQNDAPAAHVAASPVPTLQSLDLPAVTSRPSGSGLTWFPVAGGFVKLR